MSNTQALLFRRKDLARKLGVSVRTLDRMISTREIPEPDVRIRSIPAWKASTIEQWIDGGCEKPRA